MKVSRLFLLLLIPLLGWAQTSKIPFRSSMQSVSSFNATDQYWYRTTPSLMDLNGSERLANTGFETDSTNWTTVVTRDSAWGTTTTQRKSGNKSLFLCVNQKGQADGSTSVWNTPISDVTTNKATAEGWFYCPSTNVSKGVVLSIRDQNQANAIVTTTQTITANTWTKLVANGQLTGAQTGISVIYQINSPTKGDSLFIDDASLTQAWDALWLAIFKNTISTTASDRIFDIGDGGANSEILLCNNSNKISILISDGSNVAKTLTSTTSVNDGVYHFVAIALQRDNNGTLYLDGNVNVTPTAISSVGKISSTMTLFVGTNNAGMTAGWLGPLGQIQFIRFASLPSGIATTIAQINASWKRQGFPKVYSGGTIVLDIDWKLLGFDQTNPLTSSGTPPIIQTNIY